MFEQPSFTLVSSRNNNNDRIPVLTWAIEHDSRDDVMEIIPLGDLHIGNAACDEDGIVKAVEYIASNPNAYWIGMGDYGDFINMRDHRFDPSALASWVTTRDLVDLAGAQKKRILDIIDPIAHKCLGLVKGNHDKKIHKAWERAIFDEIVVGVKERAWRNGGLQDIDLSLNYWGFVRLKFCRAGAGVRTVVISAHHGYGSSKSITGMEKFLWSHECDVALFGHTHNMTSHRSARTEINKAGKVIYRPQWGVVTGTYLQSDADYGIQAGYMPVPTGVTKISLRPGAVSVDDLVRVTL